MEEWKKIIHDNRHAFYPVCERETKMTLSGYWIDCDYFRMNRRDQDYILAHAVDKPLFVLENTKADDRLPEMEKAQNATFAVVMDEDGGMSGIVYDYIEYRQKLF